MNIGRVWDPEIDPEQDILDGNDVKEYRDNKCAANLSKLIESQTLLLNFINPNTPYKGILLYWNAGTGMTAACMSVS